MPYTHQYIVLIARLSTEPDIQPRKYDGNTKDGWGIRFSVAIDRGYKQNGEQVVDFFDCETFMPRTGDQCIYHGLHKGSLVALNGHFRNNSYEKDGKKIKGESRFHIDGCTFLETKEQSQARAQQAAQQATQQGYQPQSGYQNNGGGYQNNNGGYQNQGANNYSQQPNYGYQPQQAPQQQNFQPQQGGNYGYQPQQAPQPNYQPQQAPQQPPQNQGGFMTPPEGFGPVDDDPFGLGGVPGNY
jgi:single-strand DNA-binding protein